MSAPSLYAVAGNARTKRLRVGAMGYVVPLYQPLRLAEEIAVVDQMSGGRFECGLVPGISPGYFTPFGVDYNFRKSPTFEFVNYLRAAYGEKQPFSFSGDNFKTDGAKLAVMPAQRPHPPLWMGVSSLENAEQAARGKMNFVAIQSPAEMRKRQPYLPEKMTGGIGNPLGAKALYLGNSLYRIHGTNDARTIGLASSSGCFRMLNGHVVDLASRVGVGTTVVVLDRLPRDAIARGGRDREALR